MGKPSSTQLSRRPSIISPISKMSKEKIVPTVSRRRRQSKMHKSIQNLFKRFRESCHDLSGCNSIIDLDDSVQNTTQSDKQSNPQNANELEAIQNIQDNLIVIPDDNPKGNSTPKKPISVHHSTPIARPNNNLDSFILAHSNSTTNCNKTNVTRDINSDSLFTIDLTTESGLNSSANQTVIDLENTAETDCVVSESNASMSGDSDVTVLQNRPSRKLRQFTKGIAKLNASEKGKLLELITQTIFSGCGVPAKVQSSLTNIQKSLPRVSDTPEDTYIKQVIIGKASRSSIGSNVYHPARHEVKKTGLRMIVIDGSNVAMKHGRGQRFSVRGLQICIDYFLRKGHVVKAFVPRFRCRMGMSTDGRLLDYLERQGLVIYTPSRQIQGRNITPYDDRYILQCAAEFDGVVVSGDNYRDLMHENPKWRYVIENRTLPFTWVDDMIMFPRDPLGRNGPTLEQFLKHPDVINPVQIVLR